MLNELTKKVLAAMPAQALTRTSAENVEDVLAALAKMPVATPEQLLQVARDTGLRAFLHGVNATDARQILAKYIDAVRMVPVASNGAQVCRNCAGFRWEPSVSGERRPCGICGPAAAPLASCAAGRDGECGHAQCPQLRDGEPAATARHCPLDTGSDE